MADETLKNLALLERQFDAVKKLIPVANEYLAMTRSVSQRFKNYFLVYLQSWESLNSPVLRKALQINITEEEELLLSSTVLYMMKLLSSLKVVGRECSAAQFGSKSSLYGILTLLHKQAMQQGIVKVLPSYKSFDHHPKKKSPLQNLSLPSFLKKNKLHDNDQIHYRAMPDRLSKIFAAQLQHFKLLANLKKEN